MGMHARASVVFGVDLGDREYGEPYVEVPDEYLEDGLCEGLEELIDEYRTELAGPKPAYPWSGGDQEAWDRWKGSTGNVGYSRYGYEHCGVIVSAGRGTQADPSAPSPLVLEDPDTEALEQFLQFLESKGFKFDPEKRKPQWLVTASYG